MKSTVPRPVERLVEAFSRLPGIGPKTASRLTYFLLRAPAGETQELAQSLVEMRSGTALCRRCFNLTMVGQELCSICADPSREAELVCVVEEPLDALAIERTGQFRGRYHVLHGAISPVEGIGPDDLKISELGVRVRQEAIRELILATNPTVEGETTALYIRTQFTGAPVRLTRLARGLPSGGDLEYADITTLSQALEGRREI